MTQTNPNSKKKQIEIKTDSFYLCSLKNMCCVRTLTMSLSTESRHNYIQYCRLADTFHQTLRNFLMCDRFGVVLCCCQTEKVIFVFVHIKCEWNSSISHLKKIWSLIHLCFEQINCHLTARYTRTENGSREKYE